MDHVDALIAKLREATWKERDALKAELVALAAGEAGAHIREHLEAMKRQELLEVQWEIEDVLEAATPKVAAAATPAPAAPPPPPPEEPADPNRPLTAKDLVLVYDDPRGLLLHKAKVGDRWFATQYDQRTGQPQTFELHPQEIAQLKQQLAGSPYWVLGAGGLAPGAGAPKPGPAPTQAPGRPGPRR